MTAEEELQRLKTPRRAADHDGVTPVLWLAQIDGRWQCVGTFARSIFPGLVFWIPIPEFDEPAPELIEPRGKRPRGVIKPRGQYGRIDTPLRSRRHD